MEKPGTSKPATRRTTHSRRTLVKGVAWSAPAAVVVSTAPAVAASQPPADGCYDPGTLFNAQARAMMVSGSVLGINLDSIAEVGSPWARATDPAAPGVGSTVSDEQANPLSAEVLDAINLELSGVAGGVTTILDFVTAQDTGVVNQYAFAHAEAEGEGTGEIGGAGAVGDDGAIALSVDDPNPPALGTIDLYTLLEQIGGTGVADLLTQVADLELEVGAVAGVSQVDSLCEVPSVDVVDRDYLLAYLRLLVESNAVSGVLGALPESLDIDTDKIWGVLDGIPLLGGLLSALGGAVLTAQASINLDQLTGSIPDDPNAALQLNLGDGTAEIDLAALLGGAYTGGISPWLNSLTPNTRLFVDAGLPGDAVTALLDTWAQTLFERLKDLIEVRISVGDTTGFLTTGLLVEGSLRDLLEGGFSATAVVAGAPLSLTPVLGSLGSGIGGVVQGALNALLGDGAALSTALQALNGVLSGLFSILENVVTITLNAQNATTGAVPAYYSNLPEGRFDVAPVHLAAVSGGLLNLSLGRGSVGENTARVGAAGASSRRPV